MSANAAKSEPMRGLHALHAAIDAELEARFSAKRGSSIKTKIAPPQLDTKREPFANLTHTPVYRGLPFLPLMKPTEQPTGSAPSTTPQPAPIAMMDVESSQIKSIGYDAPTQTLAVNFKTGGVYHYAGFPIEEWSAFRTAKSIGSHFYKAIKGKYPFTKQ